MNEGQVSLRASWLDDATAAMNKTMQAMQRQLNLLKEVSGGALKPANVQMAQFIQQVKSATNEISNRFTGALRGAYHWLTSIQGALVGIGVSLGLREVIQEALQTRAALAGLSSVAKAYNQDQAAVSEGAKNLVSYGLLSVQESAQGLKNLLSSGLSLDQAIQLMKGLQEQAIYNKQAHYGLGQAVVATTEGIRNENSITADATGTTENLFKMYEKYAKSLGASVINLTQAQKAQAAFNGFMRETAKSQGDYQKAMNDATGAVLLFNSSVDLAKSSLGELLLPALTEVIRTIQPMIERTKQWAEANRELVSARVKEFVTELIPQLQKLFDIFISLGTFAYKNRDIIAMIFVVATIAVVITKIAALIKIIQGLYLALVPLIALIGGPASLAIGLGALAVMLAKTSDAFADNSTQVKASREELIKYLEAAGKQPKTWPGMMPSGSLFGLGSTMPSHGPQAPLPFMRGVTPPSPPDTKALEEAQKRLNDALKALGVTTREDLNKALEQLNTLQHLNTVSTGAYYDAQAKVLDLWQKMKEPLSSMPKQIRAIWEEQVKAAAATRAETKARQDFLDRAAAEKKARQDILDQQADYAKWSQQVIASSKEEADARAETLQQLIDYNEKMKQDQVKHIMLFFDADVTRVKSQSDLATYSLGQLARALGDIPGKAGKAFQTINDITEAAAKGAAVAGPWGALAAAVSTIELKLFGWILGGWGKEAKELEAIQKTINAATERRIQLEEQLADLMNVSGLDRMKAAQEEYAAAQAQMVALRQLMREANTFVQYRTLEAKYLEASNQAREKEIELIRAEQQARTEAQTQRNVNLSFLDVQFEFNQTPIRDQIAALTSRIPTYFTEGLEASWDERAALARKLLALNKTALQQENEERLAAEKAALDLRLEMERNLVQERLRASFLIRSEALRQEFAGQFGAARGNEALQAQLMTQFQGRADTLQAQFDAEIQRETARIAAEQAAAQQQGSAVQAEINAQLLTIAQDISRALQLNLGGGPGSPPSVIDVTTPTRDFVLVLNDGTLKLGAFVAAVLSANSALGATHAVDLRNYVATLDWGPKVPVLDWSPKVPFLDWNSKVSRLDWDTTRIPNLAWDSTRVPNLDWGQHITAVNLGGYVTALDWGPKVPLLDWGPKVPAINWSARIASLSNWDAYVTAVKLQDYVTALDWTRISQVGTITAILQASALNPVVAAISGLSTTLTSTGIRIINLTTYTPGGQRIASSPIEEAGAGASQFIFEGDIIVNIPSGTDLSKMTPTQIADLVQQGMVVLAGRYGADIKKWLVS